MIFLEQKHVKTYRLKKKKKEKKKTISRMENVLKFAQIVSVIMFERFYQMQSSGLERIFYEQLKILLLQLANL